MQNKMIETLEQTSEKILENWNALPRSPPPSKAFLHSVASLWWSIESSILSYFQENTKKVERNKFYRSTRQEL